MLQKIFASLTLVIFATPLSLFAQLTSENFVVQGTAIGSPSPTNAATSENFQTQQESGALYQLDETVPSAVDNVDDSGAQATRVNRGSNETGVPSQTNILGKSDSITICHTGAGVKYVSLTNVQVFITLAEAGLQAELRGHDGHDLDIIPSFLYNIGDGVKSYPGKNWSTINQQLHENNCAGFLAQPSSGDRTVSISDPAETPLTPPAIVPITVCDAESRSTSIQTAIDDNTLVNFIIPQGAARSKKIEALKSDYRLLVQVKPVAKDRANTLQNEVLQAVGTQRADGGRVNQTARINKQGGQTSYVPPIPDYTTDVQEGGAGVLIIGDPDCESESTNNDPDLLRDVISSEQPLIPEATISDQESIDENLRGVGATSTRVSDTSEAELSFIVSTQDFFEADFNVISEGISLTPFEISVVDETGDQIDAFEESIYINIFNPGFINAADIVVLQPSAINNEWFVVPFEHNNDTITIQLTHPGELFIWIKPKTALASEFESPGIGLQTTPRTIPFNDTWLNFLQILGIFSGLTLGFFQLAAHPLSFSHIGRSVTQAWHNLIALITLRKQKRPWGVVFDSKTKFPLDPVFVQLYDEQNNKIDQVITDLDGRYGFLLPAGNYKLKAAKTNYTFPAASSDVEHDVVYKNLYYGGALKVTETIVNDIPMDPVKFDWNQYEKIRTGQTVFYKRFDPLVVRLLDLMHLAGAILMGWQFISIPNVLSGALLALYVALLVNRYMSKAPLLYGSITHNQLPVPYALIQVFVGEQEIVRRVADVYGRYFVLVSPGTYTVQVSIPYETDNYHTVIRTKVTAKKGIINRNLSA